MSANLDDEYIAYLKMIKFERRLKHLSKKLRNKKVVIYGADKFFQTLVKNYNLRVLNIVAISDRTFKNHAPNEKLFDYYKCTLAEISDYNPEYILVGTMNFINISEDLEEFFKGKIKIRPLIKKPIKELWIENWN